MDNQFTFVMKDHIFQTQHAHETLEWVYTRLQEINQPHQFKNLDEVDAARKRHDGRAFIVKARVGAVAFQMYSFIEFGLSILNIKYQIPVDKYIDHDSGIERPEYANRALTANVHDLSKLDLAPEDLPAIPLLEKLTDDHSTYSHFDRVDVFDEDIEVLAFDQLAQEVELTRQLNQLFDTVYYFPTMQN